MNIYAHAQHAFSDRSIELGELYAAPAAISVQNAQALARARRLSDQLASAMAARAIIDQAIGIMMGRSGSSDTEAWFQLKRTSELENSSMSRTAERLVADAVQRAQASRT